MSYYPRKNVTLHIDDETAVTWERETGEIVSMHVPRGGDQPASVALDRLRERIAANAAELTLLQEAAKALLRKLHPSARSAVVEGAPGGAGEEEPCESP